MRTRERKFTKVQSDIHVGAMLKSYIDKHEIAKSAVARAINRTDSGIIQFQKSRTMQAAIMLEFCHAMKYNFFRDIADKLPATYRFTKPVDTTDKDRIKELEEEIKILKAEKAMLLEAIKRS